jgi:hypothetical protein
MISTVKFNEFEEDDVTVWFLFHDKANFHLVAKWTTKHLCPMLRKSPWSINRIPQKSDTILQQKVYRPFSSLRTQLHYLDVLINWLMPQLHECSTAFMLHQDGWSWTQLHYLDMLINCLMPRLHESYAAFVSIKMDGASHFCFKVEWHLSSTHLQK